MEKVIFRDLGKMDYQQAWDYQETLLQENLLIKSESRRHMEERAIEAGVLAGHLTTDQKVSEVNPADIPSTRHYLLFVEHPPVYTLGKSGHQENVLIGEDKMQEKGIQFFRTNRGGDITFHGPGQIVGYPVLDLEKFYT
ncbi:MAG TPA: hypothetical protein VKQ52_03970, partial [Puia sp.]|nr:hypothetical protein [Puia sp.]